MFELFTHYPIGIWAFVFSVAVFAGVIKGMVGFAMPMILISGMGMVFPPEIAIAGLIVPTVVTNMAQALEQGRDAAVRSLYSFRRYLLIALVVLMSAALLVGGLSDRVLFLLIGVPIVLFTASQLLGWDFSVAEESALRFEVFFAVLAGFFGGLAGIWGPPTVAYLTSRNTPKDEQIRLQGIAFGLGAVALMVMHTISGLFNLQTATMSVLLVIPAMIGLRLGTSLRGSIDQKLFKKMTLFVLCIAGLNLVRRAVMGF